MTIDRDKERNLAFHGLGMDAKTSSGAHLHLEGSTYRPAWRAGTLAGDVVAGAPILAGAP